MQWLDIQSTNFPATHEALTHPDGLLAVGGDLSIDRLVHAYQKGIFPWYSEGQPILWWAPNPRMVLSPKDLHIGRTLKKLSKKKRFTITVDKDFERVMRLCADVPRNGESGTWITDEMLLAYTQLHTLGYAHSVETWHEGELVGGLYGVTLDKVFFGESMFSKMSGASKMAFATLVLQLKLWQFAVVDCQIYTEYLKTFGAQEINRNTFENLLDENIRTLQPTDWKNAWIMPEFGFCL